MKNMKVSKKLIVSFLLVVAMTMAVGAVGIVGMMSIDKADTEMYEMQTVPMPSMAKILEAMQRMRVNAREYLVAVLTDDPAKIENTHNAVENDKLVMQTNLDLYSDTILTAEAKSIFSEGRSLYEKDYLDFMAECYNTAKAGDADQILKDFAVILPTINKIVDDFDQCLALKVDRAAAASQSNSDLVNRLLLMIAIVLVAAVAVALVLAFYISGLISKPLKPLAAFMAKASATGDLTLSKEDMETIGKYSEYRDEIGQTIKAATGFVGRVTDVSKTLETVAGGDLTVSLKLLSDADTMGLSLQAMISNLNNMFSEINSATGQVSAGSKQIADGAQALAQGATEQASSVEELAASLADVSTKTNENAHMAREAADLSGKIKERAEKGNTQMDQMMQAVTEINEASGSISRVIKVIDDIAFQTNILALNAAVEAARAGQHGKGFAVVAEEVRNLAAKSAEAAKDTSSLIENSIEKANLGMSIATETSESLKEIVEGINHNAEIIIKIEESSNEQADEIQQINTGVDQVAQVVQQNSATAEESAAASEEMSGQANMLQQLITQFRLKDSGERSFSVAQPTVQSRERPAARPAKSSFDVRADDIPDDYDFNYTNDKY